jgi:predicted dinucleotide-binding enzyme
MKIGILGSGPVGQALARAFLTENHQVMLATRDPRADKAVELSKNLDLVVGDFSQTAGFGELLVLCTVWTGVESALQLAGQENLKGKVIIDTTNPLDFSNGPPPSLALGRNDSAGEQIQRWAPDAKVVKAFNIIGNQDMYKPRFKDGPPTMIICGNDAPSKDVVRGLLTDFGWDTVDIGDMTGARELEPLCILWVKYGRQAGTWHHAFKLLRD